MNEPLNQTARRFREVEDFLRRFVVMPDQHALTATTLWVMHTHVRDGNGAYAFDYTPRIAFLSEGPGSGKTVALALTERLSHNGQRVTNPTAPGVVRMINELRHTVCIDEIDELFGTTAASKKDLRSILNAGYESGGMVARAGMIATCFGPLAFAGMGANFATSDSLRALRSRTIAVWMKRKESIVDMEVYRRRVHNIEAGYLHDSLEDWGRSHCTDLVMSEPQLPDGVSNRDSDLWTPLLAIGEAAGPEIAAQSRAAVRAAVLSDVDTPEMTLTDRLIMALHKVFSIGGEDKLPTATIVDRLHSLPDKYWRQLWPDRMAAARGISRSLAAYDIEVTKVWAENRALQGYTWESISTYLPEGFESALEPVEEPAEELPLL